MISIAPAIIYGCWIIFVTYWFVSSWKVKKVAEHQNYRTSLVYKIPTLIGIYLLIFQAVPEAWRKSVTPHNEATLAAGTLCCVAGLFVSIWARRTLSGNWSSTVTLKQNHELIKTGPYRYARHPIYTGILLMCLASPLATGLLNCWAGLAFMFVGFWIKLKGEEALMLRHFPEAYPIYRQEVKAIVPFIL